MNIYSSRYRMLFGMQLLVLAMLAGCGSKKEGTPAGTPPAGQAKTAPAPIVVPDKDKADATVAAARVIELFKAGDFASIYREASAEFHGIGSEEQFVTAAQSTRRKTGPVRDLKEVRFAGLTEKLITVMYHVQYDRVRSELRLTFGRAKDGKMQLVGLKQKDLKK